ncbi:MAG: hypothetical protein ABIR68_01880 [Ilumatobacteraceae bacterium]
MASTRGATSILVTPNWSDWHSNTTPAGADAPTTERRTGITPRVACRCARVGVWDASSKENPPMHRNLRSTPIRLAAALAITVTVAAGCGSDSKSTSTSSETTRPVRTDPADTTATSDSVVVTPARATTAAPTTIGRTTTTGGAPGTATPTTKASTISASTATTAAATTSAATATTTGGPASVPADWVLYTSPQGDYTVSFPATPKEQTQNAPLPDGSTLALDIISSSLGEAFIATSRGQYPDGVTLDIPAALQGAQDQAIANVQGTLVDSRDINVQGRPGREFSVNVTNGGVKGMLLQRVYIDDLTIYQIIITGPGIISATDPKIAAFLDSFQFTAG